MGKGLKFWLREITMTVFFSPPVLTITPATFSVSDRIEQ
jgi:hypothetical protein